MRERGRKPQVLIGSKMVHFASRAKYDAWFKELLAERSQTVDREKYFTSQEVFAQLHAEVSRQNSIGKLSRRNERSQRKRA